MTADDLLLRLRGVKRNGNGWLALCPAHDDHTPSLGIKNKAGRVLAHCFAGCSIEQVCAALSISFSDLALTKEDHPILKVAKAIRSVVATYDYSDEQDNLLFQVVRYEPKRFVQRRPAPNGSWIYSLKDTRRVLYRLPNLLRADESMTVFIVEGEKDVDRLTTLGLVATTNSGGAGKWRKNYTAALIGRHVCVIPDNDVHGRQHAEEVANFLTGQAASIKLLVLGNVSEKGDISNWLDAGGTVEDLRRLVHDAPLYTKNQRTEPPIATDEELLQRLASLPRMEYERERVMAAKSLEIRTSVLDGLVKTRRASVPPADDGLQGRALHLPEIEPWPDPMNGAEVLDQMSKIISNYIVLPDSTADAVVLWCAHAHLFECFSYSPRLNISSPDKQCGKTTLRNLLAFFVPRPIATENLTPAVLFRIIESKKPTVLADECDAWLKNNDELRGLLNAGHGRNGQAFRCEGEGNEVRAFRVFCPSVLCGIGSLPGTLHDRSIVIKLVRAKLGEVRKRFDSRHTRELEELCRKLVRFCADKRDAIEACDPELPHSAFNRMADNWRPLFAIAEIAGGGWPQRTALAFEQLTSKDQVGAEGLGVVLLGSILEVFREIQGERVFSRDLVAALCGMSAEPWPEANRGRPITEHWLARRLRQFEVCPRDIRIGARHAKGYERPDFEEAFERYLTAYQDSDRDSVTSPITIAQIAVSKGDDAIGCHGLESNLSAEEIGVSRCHALNTQDASDGFIVGEV